MGHGGMVDLDALETGNSFDVLRGVLDKCFKYENDVELPQACTSFFNRFMRLKGETTQ